MKHRWIVMVFCFALACSSAAASDAPAPTKAATPDLTMDVVTQVKVGTSTGAQVRELLGTPWRTLNYGDCNPMDYQEIWEYLGHDDNGRFRISIEFDEANIARIVAKTPAHGPDVVLAAAPKPGMERMR
jgi:outer membrane protein assembly factor BamE (lipoprotein component of BamABCDE complex)